MTIPEEATTQQRLNEISDLMRGLSTDVWGHGLQLRVLDAADDLVRIAASLRQPARLDARELQLSKDRSADFARRVPVEQRLFDAANGKSPLPTTDECRELAMKLGVPDEYRQPARAKAGALIWRCFHCDETFTTHDEAALHFGKREGNEPLCQIKRHEKHLGVALRKTQDDLARHWREDSDVLRAMYTLEASIGLKVQQAEEEGYARGLKDAAAPCRDNAQEDGKDAARWRSLLELMADGLVEVEVESAFGDDEDGDTTITQATPGQLTQYVDSANE